MRRSTLFSVGVLVATAILMLIAVWTSHVSAVHASVAYQDQAAATNTPAATGTTTPEATATAVPTAAATSTPGVPLAAYPAPLVSRFTATRQGSTVHFAWRMTSGFGFKGFRLFAASHRLTSNLIRPHTSLTYHHKSLWSGSGPYVLHVILQNGQQMLVKAR